MKVGRPSKYKPEYCQAIIDYFSVDPYEERGNKLQANKLPLLCGFAAKLNVSRETLREWAKNHAEFSCAYNKAKKLQRDMLITNGLLGLYNPTAYIFTAKNITDMRDKVETEHSGGQKLIIERKVVRE